MPKYDAFGREIGENTLSGLGGAEATVQPAPAPEPAEHPEPAVTAAPSDGWTEAPAPEAPAVRAQPVRVRRRSGLGCLVGLAIFAAVAAGPVIAVVSLVDSASDTIDSVTGALEDVPTINPSDAATAPEAPPPPPTGIAGRSMIAAANFAPVLKALREDDVPAIVQLRLSPDRADLETYRRGRTRRVEYRYDGTVNRGTRGRAFDALGNVPVRALDPRAPVRLVRRAAARYGMRERGINYLIASADTAGGGHRWIAYFKNGVYVLGDERGRVVRRIS